MKLRYIAVTYKYISKHTISVKYPKNTLKIHKKNNKITLALDFLELLHTKRRQKFEEKNTENLRLTPLVKNKNLQQSCKFYITLGGDRGDI